MRDTARRDDGESAGRQRAPAYQRIINQITAEIDARSLSAGAPLPSERQLSIDFGVTRATVARAMRELEHAGLVERRQGQGTFVAAPQEPTQHASTLVCIVPGLHGGFLTGIMQGIEQTTRAAGHRLVIANSEQNPTLEAEHLEHARRTAQGVLIWPLAETPNGPLIARIVASGFPLVLLDRAVSGVAADAVVADNEAAGFLLTSYLLDQGHERIAFVQGDEPTVSSVRDRLAGYRRAFAQRGKSVQPEWISHVPYGEATPEEQRYNCIARLLAYRPAPTAFIAVHAGVLTMLIKDLIHFGVRIPDDVVLATTDNTEGDGLLRLATASILFDCVAMGEQAVRLLLNRQRLGLALAPREVVIPVELHAEGAISVRIAPGSIHDQPAPSTPM